MTSRNGEPARCRARTLVGGLLFVAFVSAGCVTTELVRTGCIEQSNAVLLEIAEDRAESCAPALAAWEREVARDCGWVEGQDFAPDDP